MTLWLWLLALLCLADDILNVRKYSPGFDPKSPRYGQVQPGKSPETGVSEPDPGGVQEHVVNVQRVKATPRNHKLAEFKPQPDGKRQPDEVPRPQARDETDAKTEGHGQDDVLDDLLHANIVHEAIAEIKGDQIDGWPEPPLFQRAGVRHGNREDDDAHHPDHVNSEDQAKQQGREAALLKAQNDQEHRQGGEANKQSRLVKVIQHGRYSRLSVSQKCLLHLGQKSYIL